MRRMNDDFILLRAPQNSYFVDLCRDCEANVPYCGVYTAHSAFPASGYFLPRTPRRSAGARDLFSLHGAQRDENKFEMEVVAVQLSCAES